LPERLRHPALVRASFRKVGFECGLQLTRRRTLRHLRQGLDQLLFRIQ
jgi:hypothetical protein